MNTMFSGLYSSFQPNPRRPKTWVASICSRCDVGQISAARHAFVGLGIEWFSEFFHNLADWHAGQRKETCRS
jgi:hypothetical protein